MTPEQIICKMLDSGLTATRVAEMTGVPFGDVRRIQLEPRAKYKIQMPLRRNRAIARKESRAREDKGFRPVKLAPKPRGKCQKLSVIDGEIVQCGAKCKRQYCHEHADTTRPIAHRWIKSGVAA